MNGFRTAALASGAIALLAGAPSASGAVQNSQSGWAWGNPQPQGNTIRAIDFAPGRTYAVGNAGTGLRSDDGGTTWSGMATGTSLDLDRLQVVTPDVVIVQGGDGCVVRRSDDGGRTFRKLYVLAEANCPDRVQIAYFVDPLVGYLVLRDGTVLRTTDGGETFGRTQTAVPETPQRGGNATPADAVFTSPDTGVVFLAGGSVAYRTTDAGTSWQRADTDPGTVRRVEQVDADTIYAVGPGTLLRSTDRGVTWRSRPGGFGEDITSIKCATPSLCLMTVAGGDAILRTEDGGETPPQRISTTQGVFAAGFASPTRAVGAGAGGATVTSDDAGRTYAPVGGDIGGSYPFGLRGGPTREIAFALGARGDLARTTDGGATWRQLRVSTTADLEDVSFTTADAGYVLDQRGGLFRTTNGGQSWQTLDPGAGIARSVLALAGDVVLLAGPGVRRQVGNGRFEQVSSRSLRGGITELDRAGGAVVAHGGTSAALSANAGASWRRLRTPTTRVGRRRVPLEIADLDFVTPSRGFVLDATRRLWTTRNGGRRWTEVGAIGTNAAQSLVMSDAANGFVTLGRFPGDPAGAYVLRTSDGGRTWRPQRVSTGVFPGAEAVVAADAGRAFAVTSTPAAGSNVFRSLFATSSGGDAGAPSQLTVTTRRRTLTRAQLRRAGYQVTVAGTLPGAQGGETIVVAMRRRGSRFWTTTNVLAGANNGSFTATFANVRQSIEVVAQWAGDSGRQGAGSPVLRVRVR
ncbi:MAG TPA: YCF48-related protein [Solirubrobacteraceae bacterium]|nr:YCF48-related protein [Solirubrobacteraceae bacterium]